MSWPAWTGGGQPQPGVVPTPAISNSQYTPEQWAQMQQQNWQQWAQWQQQFQQWQQQYGAEYQKSLTALTQSTVTPIQSTLPAYNVTSSAPPPPLPSEVKPPLPPDEPTNPPAPPNTSPFLQFTSAPPPVISYSTQITQSSQPPPPQQQPIAPPPPPKEHYPFNINTSNPPPLMTQPFKKNDSLNPPPLMMKQSFNKNDVSNPPPLIAQSFNKSDVSNPPPLMAQSFNKNDTSIPPPFLAQTFNKSDSSKHPPPLITQSFNKNDIANPPPPFNKNDNSNNRFGPNQNYGNNTARSQNWQNQPTSNMGRFNQPPNYSTESFTNKRSYNQSSEVFDSKRAKIEYNTDNWRSNTKPLQNAPQQTMSNESQQWNVKPPAVTQVKNNPEELSEAEKKFDKQFADWESQFKKWKEQNVNHPDKGQYEEYEKKWETWRTQLLGRREQMKRKRLGLTGNSPLPTASGSTDTQSNFQKNKTQDSSVDKIGIQSITSNVETSLSSPFSGKSGNTSSTCVKPELAQLGKQQDLTQKSNSSADFNKKVDTFDKSQEDNLSAPQPDAGSFLQSGNSDGIPGLDLVKDNPEEEEQDDPMTEKSGEKPDLEAISRGINSILGDKKIMNILSMVSQNNKTNITDTAPTVNTSKISLDEPVSALDGGSYDNYSNLDNPDFLAHKSQSEVVSNIDEQTRSSFNFSHDAENFDKSRNVGFNNENRGDMNYGQSDGNFNKDPQNFNRDIHGMNRSLPDNFNEDSGNFNKGFNRSFNQGPNNFNRGPDNFNRGLGNFNRGPDNFNRGPDNFNREPDNFNRGPGNFSRGPNFNRGFENFNKGPDNFNRGLDNLNKDPDNFNRGPDNFNRGPDTFNRGPANFNRGPANFNRGFDNFNRGPDNFNRGSDNLDRDLDDFNRDSENFDEDYDNFNKPHLDRFNKGLDNFNRGPPKFNPGPDNFNRGSANFNRGSLEHFSKGFDNFNRDSDNYNRGPDNFNKTSGFGRGNRNLNDFPRGSENINKPIGNFNRPSDDFNRELENFKKEPDNFNRDPNTFNKGFDKFNRGPDHFNREVDDFRGGPKSFNTGLNNLDDEDFDREHEKFASMPDIEESENFSQGPSGINPNFENKNKISLEFNRNRNNLNQNKPFFNMPSESFSNRNFSNNNNTGHSNPANVDNFKKLPEGFNRNMDNFASAGKERTTFSENFEDTKETNSFDNASGQVVNSTEVGDLAPQTPLDEAPVWKPETVIDYEHKPPKSGECEISIALLYTFDYRHKPLNRIPYPQRPEWLAKSVKNYPEFDPPPLRQFEQLRKHPINERFDNRAHYKKYDNRLGNDEKNKYPNDRSSSLYDDRERKPFDDYKRKSFDDGRGKLDNAKFDKPRNFERDRHDFNKQSENLKYSPPDMFTKRAHKEENVKDSRDTNKRFRFSPPSNKEEDNNDADKNLVKFVGKTNKHSVTLIDDLLCPPGRYNRPPRIVIILRGPSGSGKSFLAKLIKDAEVEKGGSAPRILCLDDYFMVEQEKEIEEDGRIVKTKEMIYEYEECMEASYRLSFMKSFKKTITDGYFTFIIVDNVNDKVKHFEEMWSFAKQNGFQVYVCQLDLDVQTCTKRNIHGRSEIEIQRCAVGWETTPLHHTLVDCTSLIQSGSIPEVEMEEINSPASDNMNEEEQLIRSKWDNFDCSIDKLAKLDGISKPLRPSKTMEDYLRLDDEWVQTASSKPGQKRVRWADLEERKEQEKMREIGFVVGHTNWNRMMDPTMGSGALTQTKYIERYN